MKYEEMMQKSMDELLDPVLESMSVKRRLRGLAPEEVLKELGPENLAKALDALTPEQLEELLEQIKRRLH